MYFWTTSRKLCENFRNGEYLTTTPKENYTGCKALSPFPRKYKALKRSKQIFWIALTGVHAMAELLFQ